MRSIWLCALGLSAIAAACSDDESSSGNDPDGSADASTAATGGKGPDGSAPANTGGHAAPDAAASDASMGGTSNGTGGTNAGGASGGSRPAGEDAGPDGSVIDGAADAAADASPCAGKAPVVVHSCASVRASWAPAYDPTQKRIELDVSALPVNVVSAQVIYYHSDGQAHGCGLASIVLEGKRVLATLQGDVAPTLVGISRFSLTDECGTRHDFEPGSASACNALQWSQSSGVWACTNRTGACIDQC